MIHVPREAREDFNNNLLRLTGPVKGVLKKGDVETLAKVLAEWARYSECGFNFDKDSRGLIIKTLFEEVDRTILAKVADRARNIAGEDLVALDNVSGFMREEHLKRDMMERFAEIADFMIPPAKLITPAAPVMPPTGLSTLAVGKETIKIRAEEELIDAIVAMMGESITGAVKEGRDIEKMDKFMRAVGDENRGAIERMDALTRLLEEAGVLTGKVGLVVDSRADTFDAAMVAKQITRSKIAEDSPVVPLIAVSSAEAQDRVAKEAGISLDRILIVEEGQSIIDVANEELRTRGVIDPAQMSFALAADRDNANMVKGYCAGKGMNDVCNFLFADVKDKDVKEGQQEIPAMNLVNVLIRITQKDEPTFMGIGCAEFMDDLQDSLRRVLDFTLKFIRIQSHNFGRVMGDLINAIAKTEVSL